MDVDDAVVRALGPDDANALAGLEATIFADAWDVARFRDLLTRPYFVAFGIGADGDLYGYITAYSIDGDVEIVNVAIRDDLRGRGMGGRLLRRLQCHVRETAAERIVLEVRASNSTALALYRRAGFERIATRKKYYSSPVEDALVLQWLVRENAASDR